MDDACKGLRALVVSGVSASGKSTLGRALAAHLGWALLDLDTMTNPLFELLGGERAVVSAGAGARSPINSARYRCLIEAAAENLALGTGVVLVAPFTAERSSTAAWSGLCADLGVSAEGVALIWVDLDPAEVAARRTRRAAPRDVVRMADGVIFAEAVSVPVVPHRRVDGAATTEDQLSAALGASALSQRTCDDRSAP